MHHKNKSVKKIISISLNWSFCIRKNTFFHAFLLRETIEVFVLHNPLEITSRWNESHHHHHHHNRFLRFTNIKNIYCVVYLQDVGDYGSLQLPVHYSAKQHLFLLSHDSLKPIWLLADSLWPFCIQYILWQLPKPKVL